MVQQFRALAALAKHWGLVPTTLNVAHKPVTPVGSLPLLGTSGSFLWPLRALTNMRTNKVG